MSSLPINFSSQNLAVCRLIRNFAPTLSHSKEYAYKGTGLFEGCDDYSGHHLPLGVFRASLSLCQTSGIYLPHASIPADFRLSDEYQ
jgi:hypothetical protein